MIKTAKKRVPHPATKRNHIVKPKGLNLQQQAFVREYLIDGNGTQAAIRAGYSKNGASVTGARLLAIPSISAQIAQKIAKTQEKTGLTLERLDREIERLAFADPRKFYNADGTLKPIVDLDEDTAATVASVETITKILGRGARKRSKVTVAKLKTWSKTDALVLAARRLGALQDRVAMSGTVTLEMMVAASYGKEVRLPDGKTIEGEVEEVTADSPPDGASNGQSGK